MDRGSARAPLVRVPLPTVLREWGRLGLIGFGGPPAHIALLRELVVERAAGSTRASSRTRTRPASCSPAPARRSSRSTARSASAGCRGAFAGGLAFIAPGPARWCWRSPRCARRRAAGVDPRGRRRARARPWWPSSRRRGSRSAAARSPGGATAGARVHRRRARGDRARRTVRRARAARCGLRSSWRGAARGRAALHAVAGRDRGRGGAARPRWTAFKVGALSYGGGFVIIPLMQEDAVDRHGWMTDAEFLNAVAFGQLTPGPVTHTVALVGWAAAGSAARCSRPRSRSRRRSSRSSSAASASGGCART